MSLTTVDAGLLSGNAQEVGMKNRIIDGGFIINQRVYVSGTALSAGVYAHDRWKAGSGGCTYTFTQGSLGVNTTITITAGTIVQVIEGCNLADGGTYVLSWTGTAQGRLNGGSYGSSGSVTITGWTAGTNLSVEFNTGTLGFVQLEKGSTATSFDYRPYGTELNLCQRYARPVTGVSLIGQVYSTTNATIFSFGTPMRAVPSISPTSGFGITNATGSNATASFSVYTAGNDGCVTLAATVALGLVAGNATYVNSVPSTTILSAEL